MGLGAGEEAGAGEGHVPGRHFSWGVQWQDICDVSLFGSMASLNIVKSEEGSLFPAGSLNKTSRSIFEAWYACVRLVYCKGKGKIWGVPLSSHIPCWGLLQHDATRWGEARFYILTRI